MSVLDQIESIIKNIKKICVESEKKFKNLSLISENKKVEIDKNQLALF